MRLLRPLLTLALPLALLAGAAALAHRPAAIPASLDGLKTFGPWVVLAAAALLAVAFNRGRVAFAAALIAAAHYAYRTWIETGPDSLAARAAYVGTCVLVPAGLAALAWLEERGVANVHGAIRALAVAAACALVAWLAGTGRAAAVHWLYVPLAALPWLPETPIPQLGLAAIVASLAAACAAAYFRRAPVETGLAWAIVAFALGAHGVRTSLAFPAFVVAAAALLVVAVLRDSHRMAFRDELTGLPGRRALDERLKAIGRTYALAMVDVDHFKKFNDTHGHDVGDQVLKLVASRLAGVGGGGTAFRYGGEEFTILFQGKDADGALPHLEQLRADIAAYRMALRAPDRPRRTRSGKRRRGAPGGTKNLSVTVSIGVAARTPRRDQPAAVIKAADKALYRAKRGGRNRVEGA
ncbi:MAG: GGDEF domain-containing protein [Burkholderiales bacterium]